MCRKKKRSGYRRVSYAEQMWYLLRWKVREHLGLVPRTPRRGR